MQDPLAGRRVGCLLEVIEAAEFPQGCVIEPAEDGREAGKDLR